MIEWSEQRVSGVVFADSLLTEDTDRRSAVGGHAVMPTHLAMKRALLQPLDQADVMLEGLADEAEACAQATDVTDLSARKGRPLYAS